MGGKYFAALTEPQRIAVEKFAREQHYKMLFKTPTTAAALNAQDNPDKWVSEMCELIAGDPLRVLAILEKARREQQAEAHREALRAGSAE